MTTPDLAGIIERDRGEPGHGIGYTTQAAADRRALLGLLRETREALDGLLDAPRSGRANARAIQALQALAALRAEP